MDHYVSSGVVTIERGGKTPMKVNGGGGKQGHIRYNTDSQYFLIVKIGLLEKWNFCKIHQKGIHHAYSYIYPVHQQHASFCFVFCFVRFVYSCTHVLSKWNWLSEMILKLYDIFQTELHSEFIWCINEHISCMGSIEQF